MSHLSKTGYIHKSIIVICHIYSDFTFYGTINIGLSCNICNNFQVKRHILGHVVQLSFPL